MLQYFYLHDKAMAMSIEIRVVKVLKYRFNNKVMQWIAVYRTKPQFLIFYSF